MTVIISGDNGVSDVDGSAGTPAIRGTDANTGIFFPAADRVGVSTGGTQRVEVAASGNVGIGTTSPSEKLHVNSGAGNIPLLLESTDAVVLCSFKDNSTTTDVAVGAQADAIVFYSGSERARIDSSGNSLVGTTSAYGKCTVDSGSAQFTDDEANATVTAQGSGRPLILVRSTSSGQDVAFRVSANRSGTQDRWTIGCNISRNSESLGINYGTASTGVGTERFYFTSAGAAYNTTGTWGTISDARIKENIVDATPKLQELTQLQVRNFNLIGEELKQIGFVAQEVEQIFPGLVETNELKDGTTQKTVKLSVFVPMLVKSIQELKAINDAQASRIETLEAKVAALEAQ